MDFKIVQNIVGNIISAVENSAVAQVKSLKDHVFSSRITNFPKTQEVKGTVVVGNQKNVEAKLKDVGSLLKDIKKAISDYKAPGSIEVSNFPSPEKFPDFPKEIKVNNFPKFPEPLKEVKISNHPIEQLEGISAELEKVRTAIKAIKLDPTINVEAPKKETVVVPAPVVNVTEKSIDYKKLAQSIASQIPGIDYQKLSEVLVKEMAGMVITSGGRSGSTPTVASVDGTRAVPVVNADGTSVFKEVSESSIILNSLTETLQELVSRLAPLAGAMAPTAQLRVLQTSVPSTAVTGPITSAQSIAEKNIGGVGYTQRVAIENNTAVQSNIINCIA